jgi:hypothetical protein
MSGHPAANQQVIFSVAQNNGMLSVGGGAPGPTVLATTDGHGQASATWTLGKRSGAGSDEAQAYSVGSGGTALFTASATPGPAGLIVIDSGNNQTGAVNQALPRPLIAVVVDSGSNRLGGVPVTFTAQQGGGSFGGQPSVTVNTDPDGRAAATLTLGFEEGNANNLVTADFPGDKGFAASFTASGLGPGDPAKTKISGLVLDNSNQPLPGVTVRAVLTNALNASTTSVQTAASVQTDANGRFTLDKAPVGYVKLLVDGSTVTVAGGFPTLEYDLVTVPGQVNTVGQSIYLLPIKTSNQLCVSDNTGGGTLTIPEAPGFSLTFGPRQVTFPGGTKTGCVSVTTVHPDKVPMVPGFGQQPRFIVTIQPSGAIFDPPAPITLPNVDGLAPRQVTEMYSFDHDINSFVAIGTGTVSDDGTLIRSNPGVGVLKAGWHCGGDPNVVGTVADCPACQYCTTTGCQPDPSQTTCISLCVQGTGLCQNGTCTGTPISCASGNPCFDDTCAPATGCTHTMNALCQNACMGRTSGSCSVTANGVTTNGFCDATGSCNLCGSLPPGTICNSGGTSPGMCGSGANAGQCQGSDGQCPASCAPANVCLDATCSNGVCGTPTPVPNSPPKPCGNGGTCVDGACQAAPTVDVWVNGTADTSDDITLLTPAQPIPISITLHGGGSSSQQVTLSILPSGSARLDQSVLTLSDGQIGNVTLTPLARSQYPKDVLISASVNGQQVGTGSVTIVDVTLPGHITANDPLAQLPDRIPPNFPTPVYIIINPDLTSSNQSIQLVRNGFGSGHGDFSIGQTAIQSTGNVQLTGGTQTDIDASLQGRFAGQLRLGVQVHGSPAVQSAGFSVAAWPKGIIAEFGGLCAPSTCDQGYVGIVAKETVLPDDGGRPEDLDGINFQEQIQIGRSSGTLSNSPVKANPNYLVASVGITDKHEIPIEYLTGPGTVLYWQTHLFRDYRTGVKDIPIPSSGFNITGVISLDPTTNKYQLKIDKFGAQTTSNGYTSGPGFAIPTVITGTQEP